MAPRAKHQAPEETEADDIVAVDESNEPDTLTGQVGEADDDFLLHVAKSLGFKEPEEWKKDHGPERYRDPDRRRSLRDFLADTPKVIADLKESRERTARAAAEAIEDERRRIREEATRVIETSDSPVERKQAAERLAQNAGPPPETRAWMARNPWFETDPDAQALAAATVTRMAQRGASIADQLAEAESVVRKRFPEYFASATETRLSDVRRQAPTPPAVQQGSRATNTQPKEKGWANIPSADRRDALPLIKKFMQRGETQNQAEARYALSYWKVNA